jgi:hypothetical protein
VTARVAGAGAPIRPVAVDWGAARLTGRIETLPQQLSDWWFLLANTERVQARLAALLLAAGDRPALPPDRAGAPAPAAMPSAPAATPPAPAALPPSLAAIPRAPARAASPMAAAAPQPRETPRMAVLKGTFTDQPTRPLNAYAADPLINLFFARFFQSNAQAFMGSGYDAGMHFNYQVRTAPTMQLTAITPATQTPNTDGPPPNNMQITFERVWMQVTKQGSSTALINANVRVVGYGVLAINSGKLSIENLALIVQGHSFGDKLLTRIVQDHILPSLRSQVQGVTLPQLQGLFAQGINGQVQSADVGNYSGSGQELRIGISVPSMGGLNPAPPPSTADLTQLHTGDGTTVTALALISGDVANRLVATLAGAISLPFDKESSSAGWGYGAKGAIHASTPYLQIGDGTAQSYVRVTIDLQVGIEGFWHWTWASISVPAVNVLVDMELQSSGQRADLHLTGVEQIRVDLGNWPSVFDPVKHDIENLIDGILADFRGMISNAVRQVSVPLFSLPNAIPGTGVTAHLSFAGGGFSFYRGAVRALINIATD